MKIERDIFDAMEDGRKVTLYTLSNDNGMTVKAIDQGGIIVSIEVPDRVGRVADVVLGYDGLADYLKKPGIPRRADRTVWATGSKMRNLSSMARYTIFSKTTGTITSTAAAWGLTRCSGIRPS